VVADVYRAKRGGGNDPVKNSCGRDAPNYGRTANAGTLRIGPDDLLTIILVTDK